MNRRKSLKALMLGTAGAASPFISWENVPYTSEIKEEAPNPVNPVTGEYIPGDPQVIHLVADKEFTAAIGDLPAGLRIMNIDNIDKEALVKKIGSGEGMIWIGNPKHIPAELSIGAFRIAQDKISIGISSSSPIFFSSSFNNAVVHSGFIEPPKEMPNHNVDEEVRADFIPILKAKDRFGETVGYPGVLMSYYAQSLAGKRFMGSECFFFLFDDPLKALEENSWKKIIGSISQRRESGLIITAFDTHFSSYKPGERIQIRTRLYNRRSAAVASVLKYSVKAPGAQDFTPVIEMRRVPESRSETEAVFNFKPEYISGLWTLRMQVLQDVEHAEYPAYDGKPIAIDQREIGFMILPDEIKTSVILKFKGPSIVIDNKESFWAGTHYYPSTSWWEWVWRDFRPLKAAEDLASIRRAGYRIVRIWIDPVIDETVLRAIDAIIQIASENGIILDICCFTQWTRQMGFERKNGEHILFDFRGKRDFNVVSFSLRNLDLQREFITIIGSRWKEAGNIMYNLANEVYVKDPDHTQMDKEVAEWNDIPVNNSVSRDSLLFRRWGNELTAAIRKAGGHQPVFPGYMFSVNDGGDVYAGNADAPMVPWHSYAPTDQTGLTLSYFDPISSERPILLEELGVLGWNNETSYDGTTHYALGAGAAGAMSYEWGVSWLSKESCYWPLPLRDTIVDDPDPRWFPAYVNLFKSWPEKGVGLCPTPSGTGYGSIYHGTPFPAAAAIALGRMGLMGKGLQRVVKGETVYVIVPSTNLNAIKPFSEIVKSLWSMKALFGIWQEADINKLPFTAKLAICPVKLARTSLDQLNSKGIKVYNASDDWNTSAVIEKIAVRPAEKIDMMIRRTENGRLLTLVSKKYSGPVELNYNNCTIRIGVSDFGLAHVTDKGVMLLEGEKTLSVNKARICSINNGRVIIKSENGPLSSSNNLKLMVTRPATVSFAKRITSVSISDGSDKTLVKAESFSGNELTIDDQLARYVIHVALA